MPSHIEKPNIHCMPPEILEKIFSYLDTENLLVCAQVCKIWECISMPKNPLERPAILGRIFLHLDRKTLMRTRLVCKFWKTGLDSLTLKDAVILSGQTFICSEEFLHTIPLKTDSTNPFPSRTVRMSFVLPTIPDVGAARTAVIRSFGYHIKFINMKINTFFTKPKILATVVSNIAKLLSHLPNLEGLSLGISCLASNFNSFSNSLGYTVEETHPVKYFLGKRFTFPTLTKLRALRLVAWDFSSEETEWLIYEILRNSPNLQLFDPDYYKGYPKFSNIFSHPTNWPFQLSILKLAVPARLCFECVGLLNKAGYPLSSLHLDILEFDWEKCPKSYSRVLQTVLRSSESTLRSLSLSFYESSKFIPPSVGVSSFLRNIVSNCERTYMRYSYLKISKLHPKNEEHFCSKVEHLKLRGFKGSLDFLKDLKHLTRLILLDYDQERENLFNCGSAFFVHIPTLKELYTPVFGSIEASSKEFKMMEEKYLRVYTLM
ncbi:unnamed protein product [Orchesella dallaii]|uniref:F-box domain-containing protein n=1 Tax=Orchesella dallaii TaxID=48710 RepID=A0ABP1Q639_9HEXA